MRRLERIMLSVLTAAAVCIALRFVADRPAHAEGRTVLADPARIATCDVYEVMQALVESERFKPRRVAEQETARNELKEIAGQIGALEQQLKSMDPKDEKTLEVFREFNVKKELFQERQKELDKFLGDQFVEAYEEVRRAANAVADREGYTHVLATRGRDEKVSNNMEQVTQQMLSRPVLRSPMVDDITDRVLTELKL